MVDIAFENTRNETVAVGVSSVVVARSRHQYDSLEQERQAIVIRNTSSDATKIITVNLGHQQAVANNGIVLRQYESFSDSSETGYKAFQGEITAICAVAAGQLSIFER